MNRKNLTNPTSLKPPSCFRFLTSVARARSGLRNRFGAAEMRHRRWTNPVQIHIRSRPLGMMKGSTTLLPFPSLRLYNPATPWTILITLLMNQCLRTNRTAQGVKTSSSRSSPPLNSPLNNTSPQRTKGPSSNDHFDNAFQGFQFGVESQVQSDQSLSYETVPRARTPNQPSAQPSETQQPSIPTLLSSPPRPVRPKPTPAPLRDIPTRQNLSPPTSPEDYLNSPVSPFIDQARNIRVSPGIPPPPPIPESTPRKRTPISKGPCRGCNEAIYGKSISSADGQLTGRYHKQCFVCKTCQAPFQSIDFYVHNNNPYCARHYHEHNHSLCTKCDRRHRRAVSRNRPPTEIPPVLHLLPRMPPHPPRRILRMERPYSLRATRRRRRPARRSAAVGPSWPGKGATTRNDEPRSS